MLFEINNNQDGQFLKVLPGDGQEYEKGDGPWSARLDGLRCTAILVIVMGTVLLNNVTSIKYRYMPMMTVCTEDICVTKLYITKTVF